MLAFGLAMLLGFALLVLHALAGRSSEQAFALTAFTSGVMLIGLVLAPSGRKRLLKAFSRGALIALLAGGVAAAAISMLQQQSPLQLLLEAQPVTLAASLFAGAGVTELLGRRALLSAVSGAGAAAALLSVLASLSATNGAGPGGALALDLGAAGTRGGAGAVFTVAAVAAMFLLSEEAARLPAARGAPLAPLHRRLSWPGFLLAACWLGLLYANQPLASLAAALGAAGISAAFVWRREMGLGSYMAGLSALPFLAMSLHQAHGTLPAIGWRALWGAEPALVLGLAWGVALVCAPHRDQGRAPGRGFALAVSMGLTSLTLLSGGAAFNSPSAAMSATLMLGVAFRFVDQPARTSRAHKSSTRVSLTEPGPKALAERSAPTAEG